MKLVSCQTPAAARLYRVVIPSYFLLAKMNSVNMNILRLIPEKYIQLFNYCKTYK